MTIKVSDIVANPYRKIDNYPIDRVKVDALKESISQTGFWDNLVVRESPDDPGTYQLAYGHHRMEAVRELGIDEVDLPVREIDNATMLRMMAQENGDVYKPHPRIIHETIFAAKEFIDAELARYATWEDAGQAIMIKGLFQSLADKKPDVRHPSKWYFNQAKAQGVGVGIICEFLGGNFKQWMVQEALSTIMNPDQFSRAAVEKFETVESAKHFKNAVRNYGIPVEEQEVFAEVIFDETGGSKRKIDGAAKEYLRKKQSDRLSEETKDLAPVRDTDLDELQAYVRSATAATHELVTALWRVTKKARELNAEQIHAVESMELNVQMGQLFGAITAIKPIVGIEGREV